MASPASLRSRRSAAQLEALVGVEREIRANDPNSRRKYLQAFSQAFRNYKSVLSREQVDAALGRADILLVGDYHALPASQLFAAALLRNLCTNGSRPVILGVETVFSRDQHILDEWMQQEIDEHELRARIRFDLDWGYDWQPFYELLQTARDCSAKVYGLDCIPREDLRKIAARDRHASDMIVEIRERHPDAVIVVLFGESHLAPEHLPKLLRAQLPTAEMLTILQNVDALYWRAAGEQSEHVEAVQVSDDVICVFNATPLEKYENYRLCLDRWSREGAGNRDLGPTIYNLIDGLLRFLDINRYSSHNTTQPRFLVDLMPEVYCRSSDALLRRLLARKGFSDEEKKAMLRKVEDQGSAYLPQINAFYIRELKMMYAAEEVARFLHHACRALPKRLNGHVLTPLAPADAFYSRVLENALAYVGSRALYPARAPLRESDLYKLYDETSEDVLAHTGFNVVQLMTTVDFLVLHREYELKTGHYSAVPTPIESGVLSTGKQFDYVTQTLGDLLGTDIYDAYLEGRLTRTAVRHLFLTHLEQPGAARQAYFSIANKVRAMKKRPRTS